MTNETVVQQLPGAVPNERLLVCLRQSGEHWSIALRQQHWAEGIGWYDQKVLRLDPRQWSALTGVLSGRPAETFDSPAAFPSTIPFPAPPRRDIPRRQAADPA